MQSIKYNEYKSQYNCISVNTKSKLKNIDNADILKNKINFSYYDQNDDNRIF